MKNIIFTFILLIPCLSYAEDIYIDKNGALQIPKMNSWKFNDFKGLGYKIIKDYEVYLSEGELSKSKNDYNLSIVENKNYLIYFEIINNEIWRGNLISKKIPIYTNSENNKFYLGLSLAKAISILGKFEEIGSGESSGTYLSFPSFDNASFYTECSFLNYLEQGEKEKAMTKKQLYEHCKIDTMIFFGNKRIVDSNEI